MAAVRDAHPGGHDGSWADAHSERAGVSGFKHFLRNVASCRRVTLRPQPSVAVQW